MKYLSLRRFLETPHNECGLAIIGNEWADLIIDVYDEIEKNSPYFSNFSKERIL